MTDDYDVFLKEEENFTLHHSTGIFYAVSEYSRMKFLIQNIRVFSILYHIYLIR